MDEAKKSHQRLLDEVRDLREHLAALKRAEVDSRKFEATLETRALHWTTVSAIGQSALTGKELPLLLNEAAGRVAQTLSVPYCVILELLPGDDALLVRAAAGLPEGVVGRLTVPARAGSMAGYTLFASEPVILEDLRHEARFHGAPLLYEQKVVSGVGVVLRGRERPYGVLCVNTTERRTFTRTDIDFLESVASALAAAIDRKRSEEALAESERRFRDLVENVALVAVMLNPRGHIVFVNDFLLSLTGWRREEVIGQNWFQTFLPQGVRETVQKVFDQTIHKGEIPVRYENEIQTRAGERRLIAWSNVVLRDMQGRVVGTMSLGEDVTERRGSEQVLKESHERYRLLFESNPHPMWVTDAETLRFLAVNQATMRQYGYTREEFLTMTLKEIRPPEEVPRLMGALTHVQQGLYSPPGIWRHRRKDGSEFEVEVTLYSLDLAGRPAFLTTAVEVTERHRAEQALKASETRYRLVSRATNEAIWDWDLTSNKVEWNEGVSTLFGYSAGQVGPDASWWIGTIHPEDRDRITASIHSVIDGGRTYWKDEYRYRRSDGSYAPVVDCGYVVHDEEGRAVRMIGAMMDLSDVKRAEAALAAEKEQLAVTLRSIADAVVTTDTDGTIVLMNKAAEDLTGSTQEEAAGRSFGEVFRLIDEPSGRAHDDLVRAILGSDGPRGLPPNTALVTRDGRVRQIAETGAPIKDQSGRALGVVVVFRDITEKRRLEEEMLKASKLESVGVLAGGIAHDFNNILTAVLGNILLIKMSTKPDDSLYRRLLEAESACLRAKDLTKQLLTFSKGGDPMKVRVSLDDLAGEAADLALRGSNIRCEPEFPKNLWPVEVDRGQMLQVIHGLLQNARQAMPDGGTIRIRSENLTLGPARSGPAASLTPGRYVRLSIADQGHGIPKAIQARIFDPYFTTRSKGSGLGLAIAYSVVTKHEGTILVESADGAGAVFHLLLPAGPAPPLARGAVEDRAAPPLPGGRILVMDDEEAIKDVTGAMLLHFGFKADFAADGEEALSLFERARAAGRPYDAVILDLMIPGGMGGEETVRRLRALDPEVRAIVSSGYSSDPVLGDFRRYGFTGMVAKPFTMDDLSNVLQRVLRRRDS